MAGDSSKPNLKRFKTQKIMFTLFENKDFVLMSTGHYFDFVGIIETKTKKPLTFFFSEELIELKDPETGEGFDEWEPIETETNFLGVHQGLKKHEEEEAAKMYLTGNDYICCVNRFRTRDDGRTGFLSDPEQRGFFLALVKTFCPEKLCEIDWA